ncbi:MAG: HlyC/CorC family transporter [Thermoanaerobaculia bacterium]|nr:HlyC/CorC family transporter [Thermoanaerobaculia bacterium]
MTNTAEPPLDPAWLAGGWFLILLFAGLTMVLTIVGALVARSGPIRLRHWAEEAGGRLRALYDAPREFEAFRFLLSFLGKLAPTILAWLLYRMLETTGVAQAALAALGVAAVLIFLFEWRNREIVEHDAETYLRRYTWVLRTLHGLFRPVVWVLSKLVTEAETGEEDEESEASEDEINAYIDVGLREGILEPEEEELVRSIVDFGDTQVRSVMTPRVEMISASVETSLEDLAKLFFESKHARLPLYRESVDQVVGILHIRDLFEALHSNAGSDAARLSKPPHFVPETKVLRELLWELQRERLQMAIVVDEYGGVAGLVTVEDLVEQIVGDISDEHDEEEPAWEALDDDGFRIEGRTYLEELEEHFDTDFDDVSYETVSGLICGELGYVPKAGEVFETQGLFFTVEEADERRVLRVAVRRKEVAAETNVETVAAGEHNRE